MTPDTQIGRFHGKSEKTREKWKKGPFSVKKGALIRPLIMPFFEKIPGQAEDRTDPPVYSPPREDRFFSLFCQGDFAPFFEFPLENFQIFELFSPPKVLSSSGSKKKGKKLKKIEKKGHFSRFRRFWPDWPIFTENGPFSPVFSLFRRFRPNLPLQPIIPFWPLFSAIWPPGWHLPTW